MTDSQILILNDELTPTQIRNLENITEMRVLDRTALILEIFTKIFPNYKKNLDKN